MSKDREFRTLKTPIPEPICVPCFNFTVGGRNFEKRTIIIAPIVVEEISSGVFQIAYGCSRGLSCKDDCCRYSRMCKRESQNGEGNIESFASYNQR